MIELEERENKIVSKELDLNNGYLSESSYYPYFTTLRDNTSLFLLHQSSTRLSNRRNSTRTKNLIELMDFQIENTNNSFISSFKFNEDIQTIAYRSVLLQAPLIRLLSEVSKIDALVAKNRYEYSLKGPGGISRISDAFIYAIKESSLESFKNYLTQSKSEELKENLAYAFEFSRDKLSQIRDDIEVGNLDVQLDIITQEHKIY